METVIAPIENAFYSVGLTTPVTRAMAGAAIGGMIEVSLKPSYSYNSEGKPRPWILTHKDASNATYLPPGSTAVLGAILCGLFI